MPQSAAPLRIGASYASYYRDAAPLRQHPAGYKPHRPLWSDNVRSDPPPRIESARHSPAALSVRDLGQRLRQCSRNVKWTAARISKAREAAQAAADFARDTQMRADARAAENARMFTDTFAGLSDELKLQLLLPTWHRKRSSVVATRLLKEELDLADTQGGARPSHFS